MNSFCIVSRLVSFSPLLLFVDLADCVKYYMVVH
uniref:Uncharacterized protein n=1 Tax=Anguilla anguilla TaxID=7936 RepID=A0A0E9R5U9_ANGAN